MHRPQPGEYIPYYQKYIDLIPDGSFAALLRENTENTTAFFKTIPPEKQNYRYAPDKWTVKDVLMHINDTERGMSFRALVAARGDSEMPLCIMDENLYASNVDLTNRSLESIIEEFSAIRKATELLLTNIPEAQTRWTANIAGNNITPRALGHMMMGHVVHHVNLIKERYL
ncbi:MAG: DinB family protein [Taibaiella sp.]|nr:DinB family protein [Taibaiella sp.]